MSKTLSYTQLNEWRDLRFSILSFTSGFSIACIGISRDHSFSLCPFYFKGRIVVSEFTSTV